MRIKRIALSVVTYNSSDAFKTIDNLITEILPHFSAELFIFDNNSTPDYQEKLQAYASEQVTITFYPENKGFGFGHNHNARLTDSEYLVICNPDILIDQHSLKALYDYMEENAEAALSAPKVLYPDGTTQYLMRQKLDVFDYMLRFIPFQFVKDIFKKRLAFFETREQTDRTEIQQIPFVSGCFMFYRKKDFDQIAGFDERFFMYFEDNDICQKTRQSGKEIMYVPQASVIHFYGRDSHRSRKVFMIFMCSMVSYFNKWGWRFF
ncbi:glycosyltransferase family 2 protein [Enterococcus sp. HY326]|uniref:glycosyltransferase family 2 protein n=1 Tax=Enterococcus sp. HY326 TaxID=2971265 RepID=UPI002240050B|nr:glycosyltransferase family 2 protein [Enterococcus sp. HY326]